MLTSKQQTVYNWINDDLELPEYAKTYKGAIEQLNEKSSGYITFVSHAGRELMNGLVPAAEGVKREQVQYIQHVNAIQDVWNKEWDVNDFTAPENSKEEYMISYNILEKIQELIDDHEEGRLRAKDIDRSFFTTFLDYTNDESIPPNLTKEWKNARNWFVGHVHLRENAFSIETYQEIERHFENLDNILYTAADSEIEILRGIHEILDKTNQ